MTRHAKVLLEISTCRAAIALALFALPTSLLAQDQAAQAAESSDEDIIVTAQRRSQRLQDVPMSITAIGADEIDRRGLVDAEDYLRGVPGVNQSSGAEGQSIVIRGLETSPQYQTFSSGPTTATYFGETPTTNSAGLAGFTNVDIKLVDIERVEVLRGPQGTSFGNSSLGGAVRTIPTPPVLDRFEGRIGAGYSFTAREGGDNYHVEAFANVPIARDLLAVRAVAYRFKDSGYYRNIAGADPTIQAAAAQFGGQSFLAAEEEVGRQVVLGGRISMLVQPDPDFRLTLTYLNQDSEIDGLGVSTIGGYRQAMFQVAPEHRLRGEPEGGFDAQIEIASGTAEFDAGWADIVATYSHTESGSTSSTPAQLAGRTWPASNFGRGDHAEDVGELRIATKFDGRINFLAGLYAEWLEDDVLFDFRWFGNPGANIACATCAGRSFYGDQVQNWDLEQRAAFGEFSWEPVRNLTLTGGLRYYEFERRIQTFSPSGFFFGQVGTATTTTQTRASGTNFRGNVSYRLAGNGVVYATFSQGFRLGKPQAPLPAGRCDVNNDGTLDGTTIPLADTGRVESDSVDNYEVGARLSFDRRVNVDAAVFRMDWSGIPVRVGAPCGLAYNTNAGEARVEGVEFQANLRLSDPVRLNFGSSYIKARLLEDVPAQGFRAGDRLPGAPAFNANAGIEVSLPWGSRTISLRADAIYVGRYFGDIPRSANTQAGGYIKVDASARLELDRLAIDLFVQNITNEDAYYFRGIIPALASRPLLGPLYGYRLRPRTIGLRIGYRF